MSAVSPSRAPKRGPRVSKAPVFVSFDVDHDRELYEELVAQSNSAISSFAVSAKSEKPTNTDSWSERVRREIRNADHVVVICSEHTKTSTGMSAELRIAQEEQTPYLLLWGRRESMCTKPSAAKSADGMYSWTPQIVRDQLELVLRKQTAAASARALRNATRKGLPDWTR